MNEPNENPLNLAGAMWAAAPSIHRHALRHLARAKACAAGMESTGKEAVDDLVYHMDSVLAGVKICPLIGFHNYCGGLDMSKDQDWNPIAIFLDELRGWCLWPMPQLPSPPDGCKRS